MKATTQNVWTLFTTHQFRIPLYQRHYDWTEPQCKALWEDFIRLCEEGEKSHYLGTMVVEKESEDLFRIVDGQQRTTSLMLLFKALQDHFTEGELRLLTHLRPASPRQSSTGTIDGEARSRSGLRLIPQGEGRSPSDFEQFNAVMANGAQEGHSISAVGNFSQNLELFRDWIGTPQETTPDRASLTFDKIRSSLKRMQIAFVELDREGADKDEPQTIFEKMNAEGKDLEVHDLIRNYIFMLAAESNDDSRSDPSSASASAKQQSLYVNEWQNFENEFPERAFHQMKHFFRDYLIIRTGDVKISSGKELYVRFKKHLAGENLGSPSFEQNSLKEFKTVEKLANDIWEHADAWGKVVFSNPIKGTSDETAHLRKQLKEFGMIAHAPYYPLATILMVYGKKDHKKLATFFETLNKFIAISLITDMNAPFSRGFLAPLLGRESISAEVRALIEDPAKLEKQLRALWPNGFDPAERIMKALTGRWELEPSTLVQEDDLEPGSTDQTQEQQPDTDESPGPKESPTNDVSAGDVPPDVYHSDRKRITTHILLKINENMMGATGDTMMDYLQPSHSLEHIMPQTLTETGWDSLDRVFYERNLHALGNLTLVGKGFNTAISNRPLEEKLGFYNTSSYSITRALAAELGSSGAIESGPPVQANMKKLEECIKSRTWNLANQAVKILQF